MTLVQRKIVTRAMMLALDREYRKAIGLLSSLLKRFRSDPALWTDRGHIYELWAAREYDERRATRARRDRLYLQARRDYEQAVKIQPSYVRALVGLGDIVIGSRSRALRYYDRAIEAGRQDPSCDTEDLADAYFAKSLILRQLGRSASAAACLAQRTRLTKSKRPVSKSPTTRRPNTHQPVMKQALPP